MILPQLEYDKIVDHCINAARNQGAYPEGYIRVLKASDNTNGVTSGNESPQYFEFYIGKSAPHVFPVGARWLNIDLSSPNYRTFLVNSDGSASGWSASQSLVAMLKPETYARSYGSSEAGTSVVFSPGVNGQVPGPSLVSGNFLRDDGTWQPINSIPLSQSLYVVPFISSGQSEFSLPLVPSGITKMVVNGTTYLSGGSWFSVVGAHVTWNNLFSLEPLDSVHFEFLSSPQPT
jgi:hypothetical protein